MSQRKPKHQFEKYMYIVQPTNKIEGKIQFPADQLTQYMTGTQSSLQSYHLRVIFGNDFVGDKEKELWSHSDYRSKFLGEQVSKRDVVAPFEKFNGPPTIRGDTRTHHLGQFTTTTESEFIGHYLKRQHLMDPALRVS